jgi:hypothetical protein
VASNGNGSREANSNDSNENQIVDKNTSQQLVVTGETNVSLKTKDSNQQSDDVLLRQVRDISATDNSTPDSELPGKLYVEVQILRWLVV